MKGLLKHINSNNYFFNPKVSIDMNLFFVFYGMHTTEHTVVRYKYS